VPTGVVYGDVTARRTNQDFRRHIRHTVAWLGVQYPQAKKYHWVMDNLNTHWSLEVCALFARLNGIKYEPKKLKRGRERIAFLTEQSHRHVIHYTPKHGSWLNQVEIWFNRITQQAIRRGTFRNVKELVAKIDAFVQTSNATARPFVWTATADSILAKVQRLCERISGTQH